MPRQDRCQGITAAGARCKITIDSLYCGHTILQHGYCSKHLNQRPHAAPRNGLNLKKKPTSFTSSLTGNVYPLPEKDPPIVTAARKGDLDRVKAILDADGERNQTPAQMKKALNACAKWTEVEEKMNGLYEKSWEWDSDTALIAACRAGHVEVVLELLIRGADVSKKSCPEENVHETATDAVKKRKNPRTQVNGDVLLEMLEIAEANKACLAPKKAADVVGMKKAAGVGEQGGSKSNGKAGDGVTREAAKPKIITSLNELKIQELKELLVKYLVCFMFRDLMLSTICLQISSSLFLHQIHRYKKPVSGVKQKLIDRLSDRPQALEEWNAMRLEKWQAAQKTEEEKEKIGQGLPREAAAGAGDAEPEVGLAAPAAAASSSSSSSTDKVQPPAAAPALPETPAALLQSKEGEPQELDPGTSSTKRAKVVASLRAVASKAKKIAGPPSPAVPSPGTLARKRAQDKAKQQAAERERQKQLQMQREREKQLKLQREKEQQQHLNENSKMKMKKSKGQRKRERAQREKEEAERRRGAGGSLSHVGIGSSSSSKIPVIKPFDKTVGLFAGGASSGNVGNSCSSSSSNSAMTNNFNLNRAAVATPAAFPSTGMNTCNKRPAVYENDLNNHMSGSLGNMVWAAPASKKPKVDPLLCWGCGKRFADLHGIHQHQWDSTKCKASARYRK